MTRIANVVAAVMVVFPVTSLLQREFSFTPATADTKPSLQGDPGFQTAVDTGIRPNIAHIVLDAYSRQDVLADLYQFDNTPFLDRLRGLGFAVADRATSPYNQTLLVMSSIFSGTMLEGSERLNSAAEVRDTLRDLSSTIRLWEPCHDWGIRPLPSMSATIRSGWIFSITC